MVAAQHSFTAATITAHRDAWAALRAMPQLAAIVMVAVMLLTLVEVLMNQVIPRGSLFGRDIFSIVHYVLITPYLIAVHRFIILGEVTRRYRLQWEDRRFLLFFGWTFAIFFIQKLTTLPSHLPHHWMFRFITFVFVVALCVIVTRVTILFPAIAVDAPGATPRRAFEDTKGHGWYIFFLLLVPLIPSGLLVALLGGVTVLYQPLAGRVLMVPMIGLAGVVWLTMAVVIASRLYQWLGHHVNKPLGGGENRGTA
jgi:hypothetical protein